MTGLAAIQALREALKRQRRGQQWLTRGSAVWQAVEEEIDRLTRQLAALIAHADTATAPVHGDGTPCTCVPGTAGWVHHHPPQYGTLPEAFHAALEGEDEEVPDA